MTTIRSARTRIDLSTGTSGSNWLSDTRKIAFAVAEPRASLSDTLAGVVAGDLGDPVSSLQTRKVIFLELDSPRAKFAHCCVDILYFPAHLRMLPDCTPAEMNIANSPDAQT
ncbi:hypothetical protein AB7M16_005481 [Bradyrhizobium sp. USDA 372]